MGDKRQRQHCLVHMESQLIRQVCSYIATCNYFFEPILLIIGNVYIGDSSNHRIRKITVLTGVISTVAGTGTSSYSGDGGEATSAYLKYPFGVAVDTSGR